MKKVEKNFQQKYTNKYFESFEYSVRPTTPAKIKPFTPGTYDDDNSDGSESQSGDSGDEYSSDEESEMESVYEKPKKKGLFGW